MNYTRWLRRLADEAAQAWTIAVKDVRVYYLKPPMIMFGVMLPIFLFLSFSIKRDVAAEVGMSRLLAMTTFFTASSAGPVIIPMERVTGTYDRLLRAPMSLLTLLVGKALVGAFFAIAISVVPLLIGMIVLGAAVADLRLLLLGLVLSSLAFSTFGLIFASFPTQSVGSIMMPSTLVRWPLLFISGIFIPLKDMAPAIQSLAHLSPLTYVQDLMNHAVLGTSVFNPSVDITVLALASVLFLLPSFWMHRRSRRLGY